MSSYANVAIDQKSNESKKSVFNSNRGAKYMHNISNSVERSLEKKNLNCNLLTPFRDILQPGQAYGTSLKSTRTTTSQAGKERTQFQTYHAKVGGNNLSNYFGATFKQQNSSTNEVFKAI